MKPVCYALIVALALLRSRAFAFHPAVLPHRNRKPAVTTRPFCGISRLAMGKGLRNKQGDLRKKLELAKKQNRIRENGGENVEDESSVSTNKKLTDEEIKERNDRLRFEELLNKQSSTVLNDYSSGGYLNKQQEEDEIDAARADVDRIFEGDPAPTACFEELHSIRTGNAICKRGAQRLVPWLRAAKDGTSSDDDDYLVVLCDPRPKSPELRQTAKGLVSGLPRDVLDRLIVVNADSPAENRRWLKKNDLEGRVRVYADEKLGWMRAYTALGDKRWSMTMFILAERRVQKLAREIDAYAAQRVVRNALASMKEAKI